MKRYIITRVYNNLPKNNKNNELSNICRKFIHAELTEEEHKAFCEDIRQLVEKVNSKYYRTTPLWVREWGDGISIALDRSDKALSITLAPIEGGYVTIKAVIDDALQA